MDIHGKVAVVTGGTRGIGRAITEQLLTSGAKVVMVGTSNEVGETAAKQLQQQYGQDVVVFMRADVAVQGQIKGVYQETVRQYGGVDIVVNSAGVPAANPRVIDINVGGVIHSTTIAVEHMKPDNGGRGGVIINVSSISGLVGVAASPPLYNCTKHAVLGFSTSLGTQPERSGGVRVLVLCPGLVKTDMTSNCQQREDAGSQKAKEIVASCGGWTDKSVLAKTCIEMIQSEAVTSGTIVKVTPAGAKVMDTENMPEVDLDDVISSQKNIS